MLLNKASTLPFPKDISSYLHVCSNVPVYEKSAFVLNRMLSFSGGWVKFSTHYCTILYLYANVLLWCYVCQKYLSKS